MSQIEITTDDGVCPAWVYGDEAAPSVLMYMDGIGMRPAIRELGETLAGKGYRVLLPDLFYRMGPYEAPVPAKLFGDPDTRNAWFARARGAMGQDKCMRDTKAFLAYLRGPVGVVGYCMGGRMALAAAGTYPDRVVASASYHPGGLATDDADSPHILAPHMRATVYVAAAQDDQSFPADQIARLEAALATSNVDHQIEVYAAKHGWVPRDTPVHDAAATERHWQTMTALFEKRLQRR